MTDNEMTPKKETERAIKKGRDFVKGLKSAQEICTEDGGFDVFAADLGEFQRRVEGICVNLEQHVAAGNVGG
jgi:hypothetical protein